ncbi:MAG: hypothetical protein R3B58_05650 [Phycisphaerales bacterium]|nr:hypothetical protein [Phycisphaerales bacterium]
MARYASAIITLLITTVFGTCMIATITGCEDSTDIDDISDTVEDTVDDAGDAIEDTVEEIADEVDDATDDLENSASPETPNSN